MTKQFHQSAPRTNPFITYRDPISGRWLTLMTATQCQQLAAEQIFAPQVRQPKRTRTNCFDPDQPDISAS